MFSWIELKLILVFQWRQHQLLDFFFLAWLYGGDGEKYQNEARRNIWNNWFYEVCVPVVQLSYSTKDSWVDLG